MDCLEAQEQILESLAEARPAVNIADLAAHLAGCGACREFSKAQVRLDLKLSAEIVAPALSPDFRASLETRLRHEPHYVWPEYLPDAAHLVGCAAGTTLCLPVLPFPAGQIALAGLAVTLITYFVQAVLRSSLEDWEESGQY